MVVRARALVVAALLAGAGIGKVTAQGPGPPVKLPAAIEAADVIRPIVDAVWRSSATFRRQCQRIAADGQTRVIVLPETRDLATHPAARTALRRQDGNLTAHVHVRLTREAPELLGHELEHVLEQIDGVDLRTHVRAGIARASPHWGFETLRAIEAGRQVAREVRHAEGTDARRTSGVSGGPVVLPLRDRRSTAASPRSARVSPDGRYVAYVVYTNGGAASRVHVFDRVTGAATLESVAVLPVAEGASRSADISRDGRLVVFESEAGNLVADRIFPSGESQVFLRQRDTATTTLLTTTTDGEPAQGRSRNPVISADGAVVAFESSATDLVRSATNDAPAGIYAIAVGSLRRLRVDLVDGTGRPGGRSMTPAISGDGGLVAFASKADLTRGGADANGVSDVYVRDLQRNTTIRVSRSRSGGDPDGPSYDPAISGNGRYVAFVSEATNLIAASTGRTAQVYLHDLQTGATELVTHRRNGRPANGGSLKPAVSWDGSTVAFQSLASDLECARRCPATARDINMLWDVFVYTRATRRAVRVSAGDGWVDGGRGPAIDERGQVLALSSRHPTDAADDAHDEDLFVTTLPAPLAVRAPRSRAPQSQP